MNCKKEVVHLMHKYLDGDLTSQEEKQLKLHLQNCNDCQKYFHELARTDALIKSTNIAQPSSGFTNNVMASLPKGQRKWGYMRWFKSHPMLTAVAIFFVLMFGSIVSIWDQDGQISVSGDKDVVIKGDTVIVPEGVTIDGDLVIKNGDLQIDGSINGDVTLINGEHLMASAGNVNGEIDQIDQVFEWMWYHVKKAGKNIFDLAN
ncbi:anti-sigma-W factor RsiW [Paraliobacillus ryukyuensis]|uniref:Anti-sigma-W factor RsiW n=1 Tax=Paraliobacillus ryukyuensis TaxID=200904 RepID=A0A366DZ22_9BACI|nr:zf-HC2 domain-containing protein [Paraliobacillus ryukyuensis]RBO95287.1 anti-sigma factor RsiW [Paraliobacillus ryukyuensis]